MTDWISPTDIWNAIVISPLALLAALFLIASALGELMVRWLKMTRFSALVIAGLVLASAAYTVAGVSMTPTLIQWLEAASLLMLVEVGQRVSLDWLRRNPWLLVTSAIESAAAFIAMFALLRFQFAIGTQGAAIVAAVCMASSPIVIMAVSKDLRARGQVTERALLFSMLSTAYAALALQLIVSGALVAGGGVALSIALQPIYQLCGSFLLGGVAAWILLLFVRMVRARGAMQVIAVVAITALVYAVTDPLKLSPLLAALSFGLGTRALDTKRRIAAFELSESGTLLAIAFFILTGAALHWRFELASYGIAIAIVLIRSAIKIGVNAACAAPGGLMPSKGVLVGVAQTPLSGVALILLSHIALSYPSLAEAIQPAFGAVWMLAILGPIATAWAIRRAREGSAA